MKGVAGEKQRPELLPGAGRVPDQIGQVRQVVRIGQILDLHLQQFRGRTAHDPAKSTVDEGKASRRIDLRDADDGLAEHRAENLLLVA